MKKKINYLVTSACIIAMLATMTGCGTKKEKNKETTLVVESGNEVTSDNTNESIQTGNEESNVQTEENIESSNEEITSNEVEEISTEETQNDNVATESAEDIPDVTEQTRNEENVTEEETADPAKLQEFPTGVWRGTSANNSMRYFSFTEGAFTGGVYSQEIGTGLAYNYEWVDNIVKFSMGSADSINMAEVTFNSPTSITLDWSNGVTEELVFVSEQDMQNGFKFYSTQELCEMALDYCEQKSGYRPGCTETMENDDGTVSIHLYDEMEDHNATSDWYTVDPTTGKGKNVLEEEVDLSPFAK